MTAFGAQSDYVSKVAWQTLPPNCRLFVNSSFDKRVFFFSGDSSMLKRKRFRHLSSSHVAWLNSRMCDCVTLLVIHCDVLCLKTNDHSAYRTPDVFAQVVPSRFALVSTSFKPVKHCSNCACFSRYVHASEAFEHAKTVYFRRHSFWPLCLCRSLLRRTLLAAWLISMIMTLILQQYSGTTTVEGVYHMWLSLGLLCCHTWRREVELIGFRISGVMWGRNTLQALQVLWK